MGGFREGKYCNYIIISRQKKGKKVQFYSIIKIVLWGQWGMISFIEWREVSAQILEHFVILSTDKTAHVNTSQKAKKLPTKIICHLGKWSRPLKESSPVHLFPHFAWCLMEAILCFVFFSPLGDHAGINCQACLTPPCHLIIACNTPECWQCWAIDSWHSLKLLIIFSHKPLSDLSTSLYCLWRGGKSIRRFQEYGTMQSEQALSYPLRTLLCGSYTDKQGVCSTITVTILIPICSRNE